MTLLAPSWHVIHPAYVHAHMLGLGVLALPLPVLLTPLGIRFGEGYARWRRMARP